MVTTGVGDSLIDSAPIGGSSRQLLGDLTAFGTPRLGSLGAPFGRLSRRSTRVFLLALDRLAPTQGRDRHTWGRFRLRATAAWVARWSSSCQVIQLVPFPTKRLGFATRGSHLGDGWWEGGGGSGRVDVGIDGPYEG